MPPLTRGDLVAVTGSNGFIGSHIVNRLLQDGYHVRAVVRDPTDESKVAHLQALPGASERLQCVGGSLLEAGGYDDAFANVAAIIHTAAVVEVIDNSDPENRIVRPAVEGTKNVVAAAKKAGVRRLVMTSSVAAIQSPLGLPDDYQYDEKDWNGWSTVATDAYGYAKTQQERTLWDSLENGDASFDAVVICPSVTLGPPLCKAHTKASTVLVREHLFGNSMNAYNTSFADVRDVAAAASAALTSAEAGGQRFIVTGDEGPMSTLDLGKLAQKALPQYDIGGRARNGPWVTWLLARIGYLTAFQESQCTRLFRFSNARCKAVLGVQPRPLEETVAESASAMVEGGWVKPRKRR